MIENLGRNSKKILKPLNTIEGIVFEFLEPPEGKGEWVVDQVWGWQYVQKVNLERLRERNMILSGNIFSIYQ